MKPIEDFMREYFDKRLELDRQWHASLRTLRESFFSPDAGKLESDAALLKRRIQERIVAIEKTPGGATVFTDGLEHGRVQYHLVIAGNSWLIKLVAADCTACHGSSKKDDNEKAHCLICKGRGWLAELGS